MVSPLVSDRLLPALDRSGFYPHTMRLVDPVFTQDEYGAEVEDAEAEAELVIETSARIAVPGALGQAEREQLDLEANEPVFLVELNERVDAARAHHRLVDTGSDTRYDVLRIDQDGQGSRTRLLVREMSVDGQ